MISQAGGFHKISKRKSLLQATCNRLADAVGNPHNKRVSHTESPIDVGHAGIGPAFRETL